MVFHHYKKWQEGVVSLLNHRMFAFFIAVIACLGLSSDQKCQGFLDKYQGFSNQELGIKLYQRAFIQSLDGNWQEAEEASSCSSLLLTGKSKWAIEASNLF